MDRLGEVVVPVEDLETLRLRWGSRLIWNMGNIHSHVRTTRPNASNSLQ